MPGKALSLFALPLLLQLLVGAACCQAADCKSVQRPHPALKGGSKKPLSSADVLGALRGNSYVALADGAPVTVDGKVIRLAVADHSIADARELKIDAVMLARDLGRKFPGSFEIFECTFFESAQPARSVVISVKHSRLMAFAAGRISNVDLLESVSLTEERPPSLAEKYRHLSYRQILDQNPIVSGAYAAERKELCDQLTTLQANGYDVNQATRQFLALEDMVRTKHYGRLLEAFARTRQCIAESLAKAQGVSVATSRTVNWQR